MRKSLKKSSGIFDATMPLNNDIFRSVFATALDTMIITNRKGEIIDINQSGCDLFGYPKNELMGKKIHDLVDKEMHSEFTQKWRQFKHDGTQRGEIDVVCADGTRRTVEYHATADFIPERMLAVLRDVSARKLESK